MSSALFRYASRRAARMRELALCEIREPSDWEALRAGRKSEFLRALSLHAVPTGRELQTVRRGGDTRKGYRYARLGFELLPDCWGAATVFYPEPLPAHGCPAVLYVCGHAKLGAHHYQYNPIMWARRGYVCMLVETIEQGDNPGEHHGYTVGNQHRWLALGYSSAGGETLNSLRALDVLAADPAVDPARIGVTGISGGGILSLYVAAVDERIKAVSSLCGVSIQHDAIARRRMFGHCDCFYPMNFAGRDLSEYAALIAPRAAMFCFGDADKLFHPQETRAFGRRMAGFYNALGEADKFRLLTHGCGHENHPLFFAETQKWFDRHVAGEERPLIEKCADPELPEPEVQAFSGDMPRPNHLALLPELLCVRGDPPLPSGAKDWPQVRDGALAALPPQPAAAPEPASFQQEGAWKLETMAHSLHVKRDVDFDQTMDLMIPAGETKRLVLGLAAPGELNYHVLSRLAAHSLSNAAALAALESRVACGNLPPLAAPALHPGSAAQSLRTRIEHALAMLGESPVTMAVEDLVRALDHLCGFEELRGVEICVHGDGECAVAALHCALADRRVGSVVLEDLPASYADGAPVPGVLQAFDIYEAVGLLAPRRVAVCGSAHGNANWPARVYARLGCPQHLLFTDDRGTAFRHALA